MVVSFSTQLILIHIPVHSADGGKVADFAGKPVVVEFDLFDADLYSFRFKDQVSDKRCAQESK